MNTSQAPLWRRRLLIGSAFAATAGVGAYGHLLWSRSGGVVRIGVAQPLSGPLASIGGDMLNGAKLAAEDINKAGGVRIGGTYRKVEIVSVDDRADAKVGVEVAKHLVDEDVIAAIAHLNSGVSIAAAPIYAKAGIPQLAISTKTQYTKLGLPTTLRLVANDDMQAEAMARFVVENLKAARVAAADDGTPYGKGLMDAVVASPSLTAKAKVVLRLTANDKTTDFTEFVAGLVRERPDAVMVTLNDFQVEALLRKMDAAGLTDMAVIGSDTIKTPLLAKMEFSRRPLYATTPIVGVSEFLAGKQFLESFQRRFGAEPYYAAHYAYDAVHMITNAARRNGSLDSKRLLERLKRFEGDAPVTSYMRFNEEGEQVSGAVGIYRMRKGRWELSLRSGRW
jgi:branched-chain amino acid transport system substrate-binding protein